MNWIKYILAVIYILVIIIFAIFSVKYLGISSIKDFSFNKINQLAFQITNNNYNLLLISYFIFSFIWLILLGFISPLLLISGYLISPFIGCVIVSLANACAGTILIIIIKKYFYKDITKFFPSKINHIVDIINKDTNLYFLIFRLAGGFGTPSQIQNLIPALTQMKYFNYFIISFFGSLPIMYITSSIGYSLKYLNKLSEINVSILSNPRIIFFIFLLIALIIFIKIVKKKILEK